MRGALDGMSDEDKGIFEERLRRMQEGASNALALAADNGHSDIVKALCNHGQFANIVSCLSYERLFLRLYHYRDGLAMRKCRFGSNLDS